VDLYKIPCSCGARTAIPRGVLALCPIRFLFLILLVALFAPDAFAQPKRRHVVYRSRAVHHAPAARVPLQPFSFNDSVARVGPSMQVAYYAPHAIPRALQIEREEESGPVPEIESRGGHPTVAGNRAVLRHGVAYAPVNAPANVKSAIWATNTIRRKPYHWGGGHGSFQDSGYDCSGTVSFALHHAGVLHQPLPSCATANVAAADGSRSIHGVDTPSPPLRGCDSIPPTFGSAATLDRAGTPMAARHRASKRAIRLDCNFAPLFSADIVL
jgi:hypothetical protein